MSIFTEKELKDLENFRWKAGQEYPNFGSRQAKRLMALLDKAERAVNRLIDHCSSTPECEICPALRICDGLVSGGSCHERIAKWATAEAQREEEQS